MVNEAPRQRASAWGCAARALLAAAVFLALVAAGTILYRQWLGDGLDQNQVNPNLSQTQRLYLEYYLTQHAAALEQPAGSGDEPVAFTIAPGQGARVIAENLSAAGLLNNIELFLNYITYYGLDGGLVTGDYRLDPRQTIPQLVESLGAGGSRSLELNFLPGWRIEEMAHYLDVVRPAQIDPDAFLSLARAPADRLTAGFAFLASAPEGASLEGFLFPDTYVIEPDTDSEALLRLMLENFDRQVTPAMRQGFGAQELTLREAVTLASIIQREATIAAEKPIMAGVFLNRLRTGMPLQADPTVQYALGQQASGAWWKSPLEAADLAVESSYNTYRIDGLPPGPIANPGPAALQAVAEPAATDFLFFVLDCAAATPGTHVFSVTYEEHLAHVEKCY